MGDTGYQVVVYTRQAIDGLSNSIDASEIFIRENIAFFKLNPYHQNISTTETVFDGSYGDFWCMEAG